MMAVPLKEVMDGLPARRRRKIEARARALIAEEMTLRELRKARAQTQKSMAKRLNIGQDGISRLEQRSDLLLSTLRDYVSALGGSLELIARFPDRPAVALSGFGTLAAEKETRPKRAAVSGRKPQRKTA